MCLCANAQKGEEPYRVKVTQGYDKYRVRFFLLDPEFLKNYKWHNLDNLENSILRSIY